MHQFKVEIIKLETRTPTVSAWPGEPDTVRSIIVGSADAPDKASLFFLHVISDFYARPIGRASFTTAIIQ